MLRLVLAVVVMWIAGHVHAAVDVSHFTRYAEFETVTISPDGTYLAVTQRNDELERIIVLDRKTLEPKLATHFGDEVSISNVIWPNEKYVLVQPAIRVPGLQDFESPTGEIGAIDLETGRNELIFGYRASRGQTGSRVRRAENTQAGALVLDIRSTGTSTTTFRVPRQPTAPR